jgi:hypothetical protein
MLPPGFAFSNLIQTFLFEPNNRLIFTTGVFPIVLALV